MKLHHLLAIGLAFIASALLRAESSPQDLEYAMRQHQTTALPANARFEIIQASYSAKATLMLDRYQGTVWQIVQGKNGIAWQRIEIEPHKFNKPSTSEPTFAIFISRLGLKFLTLINLQTGATWTLTEDDKKELRFSVIPND